MVITRDSGLYLIIKTDGHIREGIHQAGPDAALQDLFIVHVHLGSNRNLVTSGEIMIKMIHALLNNRNDGPFSIQMASTCR